MCLCVIYFKWLLKCIMCDFLVISSQSVTRRRCGVVGSLTSSNPKFGSVAVNSMSSKVPLVQVFSHSVANPAANAYTVNYLIDRRRSISFKFFEAEENRRSTY